MNSLKPNSLNPADTVHTHMTERYVESMEQRNLVIMIGLSQH